MAELQGKAESKLVSRYDNKDIQKPSKSLGKHLGQYFCNGCNKPTRFLMAGTMEIVDTCDKKCISKRQ